ncbi:MAG TPA: hypothetical protein GX708_05060 [Gallicola sp.]|jgi:hypothetical protein|nr:hypothetical protein [Gallicola sp.]
MRERFINYLNANFSLTFCAPLQIETTLFGKHYEIYFSNAFEDHKIEEDGYTAYYFFYSLTNETNETSTFLLNKRYIIIYYFEDSGENRTYNCLVNLNDDLTTATIIN